MNYKSLILTFKKFAGTLILPLSICVELLLIGIILLWFTKKQKAGKVFVTIGLFFILLFSYRYASYLILRPLESSYHPLVLHASDSSNVAKNIRWIVVLGGGHSTNTSLPLSSQISAVTLARLVEGVRLYRELPGSRLVLSGGKIIGEISDAETMEPVVLSLGVKRQDIVLEKDSRDTEEQVEDIRPIVGSGRFILVTSAAHMPRAMGLFRKAGLNPLAAPTDYVEKTQGITPGNIYPSTEALAQTKVAFYEYLGILWAKVRGKM